MRIRELLAVESIDLNAKAASKKEALDHAVDLMARSGKIGDVETYRKGVYAREEEGTTGIGEGIAIPHCKSDVVKAPGLAAMRVAGGVDFQSLDGEKADLIFLIAAPNTKDNVHLDVLSKLSVLLMDEKFTNDLRNAKSVEEFLHVIDVAESAKDVEEAKEAPGGATGRTSALRPRSPCCLPPGPPFYGGRQLGGMAGQRKGAGGSADWFPFYYRCR